MRSGLPLLPALAVLGGVLTGPAAGQSLRITPEVSAESRIFVDDPRFDGQFGTFQGGLVLSGDLRWTSADRNTRILFEPYLRLDSQDGERSYGDIREASLSLRRGDWDILLGVSQVFWGVAESRNVVDVINQFDAIEDFDEGEKLGQPMVRVSRSFRFGTIQAFYLPFFRERRFPGEDGRLRFDPVVDSDAAVYERGGDEWAGDVALRYTNRFGGFDLGLHAFHGTSRNPFLAPGAQSQTLQPLYQELTQGGIDLQYTGGPWLLKLEAAAIDVGGDTFAATVSGFEYTFFGVGGGDIDIGIISEYLYDGRDMARAPITIFENDIFAGTRITFNDTQDAEILAGAFVDTETGALIASVEFQRRIGSRLLLEVEGRAFTGSGDPFTSAFQNDSHITLRLTRYF